MKIVGFGRCAFSAFAAITMLSGCIASRSVIGAQAEVQPGVAPLRVTIPKCNNGRIGHATCEVLVQRGARRSDKARGWTPHDLQLAYKLPSSSKGIGQIVAVVDAYDNPDAASDLAEYRSTFKLPTANFTKYNQEGQTSNYPAGSPEWGVQIDIDVEMVSASCPNCTIYLVEANSDSASDLEASEAEAVSLGAHIVSNSYVGEGFSNSYFDTPGVTYLGSGPEVGSGEAAYPADFDGVVAVGGTLLGKIGGKRGWSEGVWPSDGGGCIKGQQKPPWQHDQYCKHRLANDVSAVADGVAAYDSYDEDGWISAEGTSFPAPFLAGVFGLAGNAAKQNGGKTFWQPTHQKHLYPVGEGNGSECAYAEGNYDTCTGWGSPHGIGAF